MPNSQRIIKYKNVFAKQINKTQIMTEDFFIHMDNFNHSMDKKSRAQ